MEFSKKSERQSKQLKTSGNKGSGFSLENNRSKKNGPTLQFKSVIQRKYDHLFNDIPKTLNNLNSVLKTSKLESTIAELNTIRDKSGNGKQDFATGVDQNSIDYGNANKAFEEEMNFYADPKVRMFAPEVIGVTRKLWKSSIDEPLAKHLGNPVKDDIISWKEKEKIVCDELMSYRTHSNELDNQ